MKIKHLLPLALLVALPILNACGDDDDNGNDYTEWSNRNASWLDSLADLRNPDGTAMYTRRTAPWDANSYILIRYIGERHPENLRPLYTSTVDVRYRLSLCNGLAVDSSTNLTSPAPGIFRTSLNGNLISGWPIAVTDMHVGDSCEVIIPFGLGYGISGSGIIPPYSNLRFNIRLVDIPFYEVRP